MHLPIRRVILSYAIAAAGVVLSGLSHWWLAPFLGDTPPVRLLLVLVVMASAWLGGLGPGLFATILGLLAIVAANDAPGDLASLANRLARFGSLGLLITFLFKGLHASRHRAEMKDEDLRRAEVALREKESVLHSFYESSVMAMGVIEQTEDDTRFVSANAVTDKFFGVATGKLEGRSARELHAPPEMLAIWIERFRECRAYRPASPLRVPGKLPLQPELGRRHALADAHPRIGPHALFLHRRGHHRPQARRGRTARRQGAGRGSMPGQGPIHRRLEPRAPHAADPRSVRRLVDARIQPQPRSFGQRWR